MAEVSTIVDKVKEVLSQHGGSQQSWAQDFCPPCPSELRRCFQAKSVKKVDFAKIWWRLLLSPSSGLAWACSGASRGPWPAPGEGRPKAQVPASSNQETPAFPSSTPPFPGVGTASQRTSCRSVPLPWEGGLGVTKKPNPMSCPGPAFRRSDPTAPQLQLETPGLWSFRSSAGTGRPAGWPDLEISSGHAVRLRLRIKKSDLLRDCPSLAACLWF